jgi:restriction endonuclease S subunit
MREGWTETTLGSVFQLSNRKLGKLQEEPEIFAISKYEGVVLARDYFDRRIASQSLDGYKVIGPNDWVYSTIHIDEGSIAVNHFPFAGVVSPMYTSMIWDSLQHDSRFFEYLLKSDEALIRYQENAQGTVNRRRSLSWKTFSDLTFNVPPITEQKRIVDVVSSVDAYIDALQQQVDATRTARNAVLHELLSAGGDDWTETTLGDIAELISRGRAPSYCEEDGVVVLNQKCIRNGRIHFEFARLTNNTKKAVPEWAYLKVGDSLINSTGVGTLGRASFVSQINSPTTFDSHVTLVRPRPESCFASFIGLSLNFRENEIEMFAGGSTGQTELSREAVNSFPVTLPPIAEQERIVEIVSSMDDVIQAAERAVVEAKNLRSGLLSDLLSGEHEIPVSYDELLGAA